MIPTPLKIGPGSRVSIGSRRKRYDKRQGKETTKGVVLHQLYRGRQAYLAIRDHWKIEYQLHYMLDVYPGEDGWSKRAGEAAINMELITKIDLFIL